MSAKQALIVIGRYKEEWNQLSPTQQTDFIARVGKAANELGLAPITGYRLSATPGAFIEIWETHSAGPIENAVKKFEAIGYSRYVDARWMIGERQDMDTERE